MAVNQSCSAEDAFRKHRHDVMNGLQLVKAYIQLNKSDEAVAAVNRLADWFQSLALVQASWQATWPELLWTAAQCPHLRITKVSPGIPASPEDAAAMSDCLHWLEDAVSMAGLRTLQIAVDHHPDTHPSPVISMENAAEVGTWWQTTCEQPQTLPWSARIGVRLQDAANGRSLDAEE